MIDFDLLGRAMAMAALLAMVMPVAVAVVVTRSLGRVRRTPAIAAGSILGLGIGFYLACSVLGMGPRWPAPENMDRFLTLVFPAAIAVELVAVFSFVPRWKAWLLRLGVAAGAARVLLHGTTYLEELAGPGSREWSPGQTWLILTGLAVALAVDWIFLAALLRRASGPAIPMVLAVTCAGAGMTLMLSGYATGGQPGLALAAALVGVTAVTLVLPGPPQWSGVLGVGLVGLFSLLIMGRFFGKLTTMHALLLFFTPLVCRLPELPWLARLPRWTRGFGRVLMAGALVLFVLVQAHGQFLKDSAALSNAPEPALQD